MLNVSVRVMVKASFYFILNAKISQNSQLHHEKWVILSAALSFPHLRVPTGRTFHRSPHKKFIRDWSEFRGIFFMMKAYECCILFQLVVSRIWLLHPIADQKLMDGNKTEILHRGTWQKLLTNNSRQSGSPTPWVWILAGRNHGQCLVL